MARPLKTIRTVCKNISLPEDLNARVELELYSEIEGKIPFGAQQVFYTSLLKQHFAEQDAARKKAPKRAAKEIEAEVGGVQL
jgi:hypothetical protein